MIFTLQVGCKDKMRNTFAEPTASSVLGALLNHSESYSLSILLPFCVTLNFPKQQIVTVLF